MNVKLKKSIRRIGPSLDLQNAGHPKAIRFTLIFNIYILNFTLFPASLQS